MTHFDWIVWSGALIVHSFIALCSGWFFALSRDAKRENKTLRDRLEERNNEISRLRDEIRRMHEYSRGLRNPSPEPAIPRSPARTPVASSGFGCNEPDGNLRQ